MSRLGDQPRLTSPPRCAPCAWTFAFRRQADLHRGGRARRGEGEGRAGSVGDPHRCLHPRASYVTPRCRAARHCYGPLARSVGPARRPEPERCGALANVLMLARCPRRVSRRADKGTGRPDVGLERHDEPRSKRQSPDDRARRGRLADVARRLRRDPFGRCDARICAQTGRGGHRPGDHPKQRRPMSRLEPRARSPLSVTH